MRVFKLLDPHGKGVLELDTLEAAFAEAGARIPREATEEILKYCDVDGNGKVTICDFVAAMSFISEIES
jgi:Ca2+-binding EF-hand superfamily protein